MKNEQLIELRNYDKSLKNLQSKEELIQIWNDCQDGELIILIAAKVGVDFKLITKAKATCALTVAGLMQKESINACEVALKLANGEATIKDLAVAYNEAEKLAVRLRDESKIYDRALDEAKDLVSAIGPFEGPYWDKAVKDAEAAYEAANESNAAAYAADAASLAVYVGDHDTAFDCLAAVADAVYASEAYDISAKTESQEQTADICKEILTEQFLTQVEL